MLTMMPPTLMSVGAFPKPPKMPKSNSNYQSVRRQAPPKKEERGKRQSRSRIGCYVGPQLRPPHLTTATTHARTQRVHTGRMHGRLGVMGGGRARGRGREERERGGKRSYASALVLPKYAEKNEERRKKNEERRKKNEDRHTKKRKRTNDNQYPKCDGQSVPHARFDL